MQPPFPPQFVPGDMVEVINVDWPPGSGKQKPWMGLFQDVGFPLSTQGKPKAEHGRILNDRLVCTVETGDRLLVVAVRYHPADQKWYYLLRRGGMPVAFGWTRSAIRLRKEQL